MRIDVRRIIVIGLLCGPPFAPAATAAQATMPLRPPEADLPGEYSRLVSIRELADGRVLLSDNRENVLVVADPVMGSVKPVARLGSGPLEFRRAGPLIALSGDSTLMPDLSNGRWLILAGATPVHTTTQDDRAVLLAGIPAGADRFGHVTGVRFAGGPPTAATVEDSTPLLRIDRGSGRIDTVTILASQRVNITWRRGGGTGPTIQRITIPPWSAGEQALLFPDGSIAIARLNPYRVDWIAIDGRLQAGAPLPFEHLPFDEDEKRAWLAGSARRTGRAVAQADSRDDWPDEVPPFSSVSSVLGEPAPALMATPEGWLAIRRFPSSTEPGTRYDMVDRQGRLARRLTLPPSERILGFGARSVYIVATDDDGIERVRRHSWP
jgi:hypothetical protein